MIKTVIKFTTELSCIGKLVSSTKTHPWTSKKLWKEKSVIAVVKDPQGIHSHPAHKPMS
jgi:hypothetical protein